jgi:hypothetical protein
LAALILLLSSQARGEDAKALLKEGNKLFSTGEYQEAYKVFEKGFKVDPKKPVFLRSMAFSLLKLFRHEKAQELLKDYVKKYPKVKDNKKIKDLVASLDEVVQTKLRIESTPPGAEIFIDAEAAGKVGTTPADLTMKPGKHLVILKAEGFFATTQPFEIKAKESKTLKIMLEVPLKVSSTPAGASVHLGSPTAESLGNTPLETGLRPGKRVVYVKHQGYKTHKSELEVVARKPVNIDAALEMGIKVTSSPPGATVEVDGKPISGETPLEAGITKGSHTIAVKLAGFKPFTQQVDAEPGKVPDIHAELSGGLLTMRTDVSGATVIVGGQDLGQTPMDKSAVPMGNQKVLVHHPDRKPWTGTIDFTDTEVVTADLTMARPTWPVWVAGGAAAVGVIVGSITGGIVASRHSDFEQDEMAYCAKNDCNDKTIQHVSTASFITAGVAAAVGLVYYLVWGRHKEAISRSPVSATASK